MTTPEKPQEENTGEVSKKTSTVSTETEYEQPETESAEESAED